MTISDASQASAFKRLAGPAAIGFLMPCCERVAGEVFMASSAVGFSQSGPCPVATWTVGDVGDTPPAVFLSVGTEFAFHRLRLAESDALERSIRVVWGRYTGRPRSDAP